MQIINTTIATTTASIKELIQYCIVHEIDGAVNLTIHPDGDVTVWQPETSPVQESVISFPKVVSLERFPVCDEFIEPHQGDFV